MIHEIGLALQTALRTKGCPLPVVDRESTTTTTFGRERIVVEHDGSDAFGPVRGQHKNPKHRMTRRIGAKVTIYAQSVKSGAQEWEHRRRAEHVLDLVLVGLSNVAVARKNVLTLTGGRFVQPADLAESEQRAGAVYEVSFTFDRAVEDRTWAGEARPEFTLVKKTMSGSPTLTFAEVGATGDTITRSAGSWLADGFAVGDIITVERSASNNVTGPIASLTATVITLGTTDLVNEGPVAGCTVTAGGIKSSTHVSIAGADEDADDDGHPDEEEIACGS